MSDNAVMALFIGFDRRAVADALALTAHAEGDWTTLGHKTRVSVWRVLSWSWNPMRLARCKAHLEAGEKAPPINVTRIWLGAGRNREAYYLVNDGNHRTEAARAAGCLHIRATITGETVSRPENYSLDEPGCKLWRQVGRGVYTLVRADLSPEVIAVLRAMGVRSRA